MANAVKNLWANLGAYMKGLATFVFSGGKTTGDWASSGDPITGRDMIALLATIGIDLGILALAMIDRAPPETLRDGLSSTQGRLHLPPASVVRQLASAFDTAISRAPGASLEWVRQHFIHHSGASYFVIPNLYSVDQKKEGEELRALAVNQLAGVFDDLKLIRALSPNELKKFGEEERRASYTDLSRYRDDPVMESTGGWFGGNGKVRADGQSLPLTVMVSPLNSGEGAASFSVGSARNAASPYKTFPASVNDLS